MDERTVRAIAEMVRCAARFYGVELTDVEVTVCKPVDYSRLATEDTEDL